MEDHIKEAVDRFFENIPKRHKELRLKKNKSLVELAEMMWLQEWLETLIKNKTKVKL